MAYLRSIILLFIFFIAGVETAHAEFRFGLTEPVSTTAVDILKIHTLTSTILVVMLTIIVVVVGYILFFHRKSRGFQPDLKMHKSTFARWTWLVVPALVLGVDLTIAGNAERVLKTLWLVPQDADMMDIKVTAHQWWWEYEYPDQGVKIESRYTPQEQAGDLYLREVDNPLVLPTNKKIRFLHTSADVIHSFWVPQLGMKKDAIAGYITETWTEITKEGTFRGQCALLCGTWHARMPIVVKAVSMDEFNQWVDKQKNVMQAAATEAASDKIWSKEELMEKGQGSYNKYCSVCHQLGGEGLPPNFPPLKGSKIANGPVADHIGRVLHGKNMMPAWDILNNLELAAIITYERNSWGNTTGDVVQPTDIQAAR
jgi:cytochrome c oxidase subunit 2